MDRGGPEPLFLLGPPGSGAELVCAVLGQNPECYALPETHVFLDDNLGATWERIQLLGPYAHDGLIALLSHLHDGDQSAAAATRAIHWVNAHARWSAKKFLEHIQACVGPKILIDHSPSTALSRSGLQRIAAHFSNASYLHVTRHPSATCHALLRDSLQGPEAPAWLDDENADPETIWTTAHENIREFLERVPLGLHMRVVVEALCESPEIYVQQIAEWLGLPDDSATLARMAHPTDWPFAHFAVPEARPGEDPEVFSPALMERLSPAPGSAALIGDDLAWRPGETFGKLTVKLARQFGYR